jgi:DNA-binding transcriptional ArsR family regulator
MQDQAFYAISDEHRRQILKLIRDMELSSGEIAAHFDVTRPAISQHLKVLADANLVTIRRDGTRRLYRARPEGLVQVREFLDSFWDVSLERLKRAAENQEKGIEPYGFSRQ